VRLARRVHGLQGLGRMKLHLPAATNPETARLRAQAHGYAATALAQLNPEQYYTLTIEPKKATRSLEQNAYLFGVCYPLLAEAKGYEVNSIHEWMCGQFFGWVDRPCPKTPTNPHGVESVPFRTTTRDEEGKRNVIGKMQFCDFVAMVQRVGAEAGVVIPDPNEMEQP